MTSSTTRDPGGLNLKNHCLFCLQPQTPGVISNLINVNSKNIESFQPLLSYLTGTDPTLDISQKEFERRGIPMLKNLPPMCEPCYNAAGELYQLHQQLLSVQELIAKQTDVIKATVRETRVSRLSAQIKFCNKLSASGMPADQSKTVRSFVENFHNAIIFEGGNNVRFPSKLASSYNSYKPNKLHKRVCKIVLKKCDAKAQPVTEENQNPTDFIISVSSSVTSDLQPTSSLPSPATSDTASASSHPAPSPEVVMLDDDNDDDIQILENFVTNKSNPGRSQGPENSQCSLLRVRPLSELTSSATSISTSETGSTSHGLGLKLIRITSLSASVTGKGPPGMRKTKIVPLHKSPRYNPQMQSCDLCGQQFPITFIFRHLKRHVPEDFVTKCANAACPYFFSCRLKMEAHLKRRPDCRRATNANYKCLEGHSTPKVCPLVDCRFSTLFLSLFKTHLKKHEQEAESSAKIIACPISNCGITFAIRESLAMHLYKHDLRPPKTTQICKFCKKSVKNEEMIAHLKDIHQVTDIITCKQCPIIFYNWTSHLKHLSRHNKDDDDSLVCDICPGNKKFKELVLLRRHYFKTHKLGTVLCDKCPESFPDRASLRQHKRQSHSLRAPKNKDNPMTTKKRKVNCRPKQATPKRGLVEKSEEKTLKSQGPRPRSRRKRVFKCDICVDPPQTFGNSDSVRSHKIRFHGEEPVNCKYCNRPFKSIAVLRRHERTHTRIFIPFRCTAEGCERQFPNRHALNVHERVKHLNILDHLCDICGKGFAYSSGLRIHKKKGHSDKERRRTRNTRMRSTSHSSILCDVCGKSFKDKRYLKAHQSVHTGDRPFNCEICNQSFRLREILASHKKGHALKGDKFKPRGPAHTWTRKKAGEGKPQEKAIDDEAKI